jgi:flavin prenyltransferase
MRVGNAKPRIIVGISGASGAAIGCAVVARLFELGAQTHLVVSEAARRTLAGEVGPDAFASPPAPFRWRE